MRSKANYLFSNTIRQQRTYSKQPLKTTLLPEQLFNTATRSTSHPSYQISWRLWLGCMSAASAVGVLAWYRWNTWHYLYPIHSGQVTYNPAFIEKTDTYKALLKKLKAPGTANANKEIILTGDEGVGKSRAISHILQPQILKEWFRPNQYSHHIPREFIPDQLKNRPWLIVHYKGSWQDYKNIKFQDTLLAALVKTKNSYHAIATEHYSVSKTWQNMQTLEGIGSIFLRIASNVIPIQLTEDYEKNRKEALLEFKTYLEQHPGWLIILDDMQTFDGIEEFLPKQGGTIIFTTHDRHLLGHKKNDSIEFDGFTYSEAIHFVRRALGVQLTKNEENIEAFIKKFATQSPAGTERYTPLFLDQACKIIKNQNISIEKYLSLLETEDAQSICDEGHSKHEYLPMYQSLGLILAFFHKTMPGYARPRTILCPQETLLFILCNLNHTDLSNPLIENLFCSLGNDPLSYVRTKYSLLKYGLISQNDSGDLSMHPLLHKILHEYIQKSSHYSAYRRLNFGNLMTNEFLIKHQVSVSNEPLKREVESYDVKRNQLDTHFHALQKTIKEINIPSYPPRNKAHVLWSFLENLAHHSIQDGDYIHGQNLLKNILTRKEAIFGINSLEVAAILNTLSEVCVSIGDDVHLQKAVSYTARSQKICESSNEITYRRKCIETLLTRSRTLCALGGEENFYAAIKSLEKALIRQLRASGSSNRMLIQIQSTLGTIHLHLQGVENIERAIDYFESCLLFHENEYAAGNLEISTIHIKLGQCYELLNVYSGNHDYLESAIKYTASGLEMRLHLLNGHHYEIGMDYNSLGILHAQVKTEESFYKALRYYDLALSIFKHYPFMSQHVIGMLWSNKGIAHLGLDNTEEAIFCLKRTVSMLENMPKINHPALMYTLFFLGIAYLKEKRYTEGSLLITKALEIFKNNFLPGQWVTIKIIEELPKLKNILEKLALPESKSCLQSIHEFESWAKSSTKNHNTLRVNHPFGLFQKEQLLDQNNTTDTPINKM